MPISVRTSRMTARRSVLALVLSIASSVSAGTVRQGRLAPGTRWETVYHVVDSGVAGPTVLVTGGVHGNEPAGALAAQQIAAWPVSRGRLLVLPRCNEPGLHAHSRHLPGVTKAWRDLNRNFPYRANRAPRGEPAGAIWALVAANRPDVVLDLHEGYGVRGNGSKSVGSSVIRNAHPRARLLQTLMLDTVNAEIPNADSRFVPLSGTTTGTFARACAELLGSNALILETTYRNQAVAWRVRQHRLMVHAVLTRLGMAAGPATCLLPATRKAGAVRVARYNGPGAGYDTVPDPFERLLIPCDDILLRRICAADIRDGVLTRFDAVIFPGGSGSGQAKGLGEACRERVRQFVRDGGGYVGICGGAYLATANYDWSLGIIDGDSIDRSHWRRGRGTVTLGLTDQGRQVLAVKAREVPILFAQGPLLAPGSRDDLEDYTVLARFLSGVGKNGADPQTMVDTPAIVTGSYGRGRVVVCSPHPEQTDDLRDWLGRLVRWSAGCSPHKE